MRNPRRSAWCPPDDAEARERAGRRVSSHPHDRFLRGRRREDRGARVRHGLPLRRREQGRSRVRSQRRARPRVPRPGGVAMNILVLSHADVVRLLPMAVCIDVMADALRATSRGDAVLPLRSSVWKPDRTGMIGLMPGYLADPPSLGLKVVSIFPGNHGTGYDSHQGVVMVFDLQHGVPRAITDASSITAIRTAAISGVATRALACEDAGDVAILGAGVQAATHIAAMRAVRPVRRVRIWSRRFARDAAAAQRFIDALGAPAVEIMPTARAAVEGADLICTRSEEHTS